MGRLVSLRCVFLWQVACSACLPILADRAVGDAAISPELTEIVVTATLRQTSIIDTPLSVTVIDKQTLEDAGRANFADVLALIPNLNWAGDTSLPRYFQLRGIGELEQYQGAPNPSVGFLLDDIDFSGLGTVGTLYDLDRAEVLRGPQATRYGANALAGMIYLRSAAPTDSFYSRVDLSAGDYGERSEGAVISGPVEALDSGFRLAAQHMYSNGYYHNVYLNRDDTDAQNEDTIRARWRYAPSPRFDLDLTALHVAVNNGYDAFAIDNSRNTRSDQPGVDSQHSTGASLHAHYMAGDALGVTLIGTYAKSIIHYGYDGDWGNPQLWAPVAAVYQYSEVQHRERATKTLELRVGSEAKRGFAWLAGVYASRLDESLVDLSLGSYRPLGLPSVPANDVTDSLIGSGYEAHNLAAFGELDGDLADDLRWSVGARAERWSARYSGETTQFLGTNTDYGNAPVVSTLLESTTTAAFAPTDHLWGGHASLTK